MKYEETTQMRINAVKDLLFILSADVKNLSKGNDSLKDYIEKNKQDQNLEMFLSKESLDNELQNLMSSNYKMEAELQEFKEKIKEVKKDPESNTKDQKQERLIEAK